MFPYFSPPYPISTEIVLSIHLWLIFFFKYFWIIFSCNLSLFFIKVLKLSCILEIWWWGCLNFLNIPRQKVWLHHHLLRSYSNLRRKTNTFPFKSHLSLYYFLICFPISIDHSIFAVLPYLYVDHLCYLKIIQSLPVIFHLFFHLFSFLDFLFSFCVDYLCVLMYVIFLLLRESLFVCVPFSWVWFYSSLFDAVIYMQLRNSKSLSPFIDNATY